MHWRMTKFPIRPHNWQSPCHVAFRRRNPAIDFRNLMTSRLPKAYINMLLLLIILSIMFDSTSSVYLALSHKLDAHV